MGEVDFHHGAEKVVFVRKDCYECIEEQTGPNMKE